jgi:CBS domain-containing protein
MDNQGAVLVRDSMHHGLVSVGPGDKVNTVQRLIEDIGVSAVPVVQDGVLLGIISTRDLAHRARLDLDALARGTARVEFGDLRAVDVMRHGVLTIDIDATVIAAARTMLDHHVHRLVVVQGSLPVGIISTRDCMAQIVASGDRTPLGELMTSPALSIDIDTSVEDAVRLLDTANVRGVVVVDGQWPVGVFTQSEAAKVTQMSPADRALSVERVMSYETICLDIETPTYRVAAHVRDMGVRRVLAVSKRELMGIASAVDLLRSTLRAEDARAARSWGPPPELASA